MTMESLTNLISEKIKSAQNQEILIEEIYTNLNIKTGKNEFLFFIKPEITMRSDTIELDRILNIIQDKILNFDLSIHNIKILAAKYLEQFNIMAQHYGVINKISTNAQLYMSESAKVKFKDLFGKDVNEVKVLGGFEFLEQYPTFNASSLDYLWNNLDNMKLAGGTYCESLKIDDETIYLVNGFHPRQLKHFTEKGKCIVVMSLSGNIPWCKARNNFIGATNPANANIGSLRREFFNKSTELGLSKVSQDVNGVHLSAGPVEALIELKRFNSDFSNKKSVKEFTDFAFGVKLEKTFTNEQFEKITSNINISTNGKTISVFDLTEEKDSDDAITILENLL